MVVTWTQVLAVLGGIGTIGAGVRYFAKKFVDVQFDKRLTAHKHELELDAEAVRTDNQRRLREFGLYVDKKHQVYPELYKLILMAEQALDSAYGHVDLTDVSLNVVDVKRILDESGISDAERQSILQLTESGHPPTERLEELLQRSSSAKTNRAVSELHDFFLINALYLSPDVSQTVGRAIVAVDNMHYAAHWSKEYGQGQTQLQTALTAVRARMTAELGAGNYQQRHPIPAPDITTPDAKPEANPNQ